MKFIRFLKTDVKIINSYFLIILILLILICVGYSSYALFSISKTSNNIIELEVGEMTKLATEKVISQTDNLNESGLYTIVHSADSTLQIGATESITEYRYRGASPKNYVTFNNETWRIIGIFPTEDEKSIAYKLTFSDNTRTLEEDEVMEVFKRIIDEVTTKCNAVLRDK